MITNMIKIPVTETDYPFQSAAKKCNFKEIGYIEDEYLMSGTANVYAEKGLDHQVEPIFEDAPYTTRLLIRRPEDTAKFSGNVVVEILNASAWMDIDRMWVNTWQYLTRNGDVYIGITSKGHVVDTLKRFNTKRYADINWANPMPERKEPEQKGPFGFLPQYEQGLYWDMQTDLARLLRTDSELNPIRSYGKCWLYLLGWSQSGSYMARTITSFAYREKEKYMEPLFDGYLEAGADSALAPVNAYETSERDGQISRDGTLPKAGMLLCSEPYIAINTESENRGANWAGDSDLPGQKFRSYQIAGSSHDSWYNMLDYYEGYLHEDAVKYNFPPTFWGVEGEPLDTPYHYIFQAALRNLYVWVREGVPAPHAPRIEMVPAEPDDLDALTAFNPDSAKTKFENKKDLFGNTAGGIRMACMDYPVGKYISCSKRADGSYDAMFGTVYPFAAEQLAAMYGSLDHYRELAEKSAAESVALGFLLKEDVPAYVDFTVNMAKRRGLK